MDQAVKIQIPELVVGSTGQVKRFKHRDCYSTVG